MPSQIPSTNALALQDPVGMLFGEMHVKCVNANPSDPSCLGLNKFPIIHDVFTRIYNTQVNFNRCKSTLATKSQMIYCTDKKLPGVQLTLSATRDNRNGPTKSLTIYRFNANELRVARNAGYGLVDTDPNSFRMECSLEDLPENKLGFICGHSTINYELEGSEDNLCKELYTPPKGPTVSMACENDLPLLNKYLEKAPIEPIVIPMFSYIKVAAGIIGTAAFGYLTVETLNNLRKVYMTAPKAKDQAVQKAIEKLRNKALMKNAVQAAVYGTAALGSYYFAKMTYLSAFTGFYEGLGCEGEPIWFK